MNSPKIDLVTSRRKFLSILPPATAAIVAPAQSAFNPEAMAQLWSNLRKDENKDLKGVHIVSDGRLVAEEYFNAGSPDLLHDIRSAGKSITALLAGIAIDKHRIPNVQVPIARLLGAGSSPQLNPITLEHLLTMRSGLSADDDDPKSPGNENLMDQAASWLDFALSVPVREKPGQIYQYSSLNAFLAGACVEIACRQPLDEFARQHLFSPLGIHRFEWRKGPDHRVAGQGNLRITLPAMSALGQMCLNNGRVGSSQIVSAHWIHRSLSSIVPISHADPFADSYGYMWYTKTHDVSGKPIRVHFASGNGGNKIYVVPALKTVVAVSSAAYRRPYAQRRSQQILLAVLNAYNLARTTPGV